MGKNYFTEEQIKELQKNPNVKKVSEKAITYAPSFRKKFYEELQVGKGRLQILREHGFDTKVLGIKRINSLTTRVKKQSLRDGQFDDLREVNSGRPKARELTDKEEIAYLKHQLTFKNQQIEALKKMKQVEREAHWKYLRNHKKSSK